MSIALGALIAALVAVVAAAVLEPRPQRVAPVLIRRTPRRPR
jgi:hypothetical protein